MKAYLWWKETQESLAGCGADHLLHPAVCSVGPLNVQGECTGLITPSCISLPIVVSIV